jgi:hypothetical protein
LDDDSATQLGGKDRERERYFRIAALATELEARRLAVAEALSGQAPSQAIWLGWDSVGWVYDRVIFDIRAPRMSTRDGIAGTTAWYRAISRPGMLPLDAVWCPTPREVDELAARLWTRPSLTPEQAHNQSALMGAMASVERAGR